MPTTTIEKIVVDPENVRFDDTTGIDGLAASILSTGLVQPIILNPENEMVIAGHRRAAAIRMLVDTKQVPSDYEFEVVYKGTAEVSSLQMMLVENLQREDLDPIEEAKGYERMVEDYGFKHKEIATRVGRSVTTVSKRIKLLTLPPSAQVALSGGAITLDVAEALIPIADNNEAINEIITLKLNVQQVKQRVEQIKRSEKLNKQVALVDFYGGVGISDYKAMVEHKIEVAHDAASLTNPLEEEIELFVDKDKVYKVSVGYEGDVTIQQTRPKEKSKANDSTHEQSEKIKRAAKRDRQAKLTELVITSSIKASDIRPLVNNMMANMMGAGAAKLACRYLGMTSEQMPKDKYGDPNYPQAIVEALDSNGVQSVRAQIAVVAAFWESRHGAHITQLDPTYGVLLDLLGIELDPKTLAPIEDVPDAD